jgi:hypothetical protein
MIKKFKHSKYGTPSERGGSSIYVVASKISWNLLVQFTGIDIINK